MNTSTGHVVDSLASIPAEQQREYTPLPLRLHGHARKLLNGRAEGHVDLGGNTPLAVWARRQEAAKKRRRKAAKRARQQQRRLAKRRGR